MMLRQARAAIKRELDVSLERQEVTLEQLEILFFLAQYSDGATVDEITTWCFKHKAGIIQLLKRMENKGMINREKKPGQKRVFFHITDKGKQLYNICEATSKVVIETIEQRFSEDEMQWLNDYLGKIRDASLGRLGIQAVPPRKPNT